MHIYVYITNLLSLQLTRPGLASAFPSNLGIVGEYKTSTLEINIWVILEYERMGRFSVSKGRNFIAVKPFSGSVYLSKFIQVLTPDG